MIQRRNLLECHSQNKKNHSGRKEVGHIGDFCVWECLLENNYSGSAAFIGRVANSYLRSIGVKS